MSWLPQNLAETCSGSNSGFASITTCQQSTFMFLQLITTLLGRSLDEKFTNYIRNDHGFTNSRSESFFKDNHDFSNSKEYSGNLFKDDHGFSSGGGSGEEKVMSDEFDFIVVGAGSAGCVVANRLTEVPNWNVLLLEAGTEEPEVADVPGLVSVQQVSSIDWNFRTQPQQTNCRARQDGRCPWPRGKVMGGSSVINYMIYLRGGRKDYDDWAHMGNPGWSFEDVFPYFLKSEDNRNIYEALKEHQMLVDQRYHGTGGEWTVEYFPYQDQNVYYLLEAYKELGLEIFDQNMEHQIGASLIQHTNRHGKRVSSNIAFIRPIRKKRPNLKIHNTALVTKILINPQTKTAYGVEYIKNGKIRVATARKEVIISAGVILSPKLLMVSGIGPKTHLEDFNIKVIQNLEGVGQNLHDHTTIDGIVMALSNKTSTLVSNYKMEKDLNLYRDTQKGPLSATGPLQVNAFVATSYETEKNRPDIQFSMDSTNVNNFYTDPVLTAATTVLPVSYYNAIMIRPVLLAPKSRGYILLNDTDPMFGDPLIYPNTFVEPEDLQRMIEGIRIGLDVADTKVMVGAGARIVSNQLPGCEDSEFGTDEYFACVSTLYTTTLYHPVGTCMMGPKDNMHSVVDHKLKVHGIKNLRVIDSSIIPLIPRANTGTATIMIGEKGADMIKAQWLKQPSDYFDITLTGHNGHKEIKESNEINGYNEIKEIKEDKKQNGQGSGEIKSDKELSDYLTINLNGQKENIGQSGESSQEMKSSKEISDYFEINL